MGYHDPNLLELGDLGEFSARKIMNNEILTYVGMMKIKVKENNMA